LRNPACRLEQQAPDVAVGIFEGLDEILIIIRSGLPAKFGCSLRLHKLNRNHAGTVRPSVETRSDGAARTAPVKMDAAKVSVPKTSSCTHFGFVS
jgi:hypothetical protein